MIDKSSVIWRIHIWADSQNPEPNCGNWCVQGPFCGFRWSTDEGRSWTEPRLNMKNGSDNLFGENAFNNSKVGLWCPPHARTHARGGTQ